MEFAQRGDGSGGQIVGMTEMTMKQRMTGALVAASLAVAAVLGPGTHLIARLGASEQTVSVAGAIRSDSVLAEVAAGRRNS